MSDAEYFTTDAEELEWFEDEAFSEPVTSGPRWQRWQPLQKK